MTTYDVRPDNPALRALDVETLIRPNSTPPNVDGDSEEQQCPQCGRKVAPRDLDAAQDAQRRICELEEQINSLTGKATAAVDRAADLESKLLQLRDAHSQKTNNQAADSAAEPANDVAEDATASNEQVRPELKRTVTPTSPADPNKPLPETPAAVQDSQAQQAQQPPPQPPPPGVASDLVRRPSTAQRLGNFLSRRALQASAAAALASGTASAPASASSPQSFTTLPFSFTSSSAAPADVADLNNQLVRERAARTTAESKLASAEEKLASVNAELEELSASLFQQANEMVADERRARAKLEERAAAFEARAGKLEKKVQVLERRDGEKARRLERLEAAVGRIERVRGLLSAGR